MDEVLELAISPDVVIEPPRPRPRRDDQPEEVD
jgi:hypothetical protein